MAHLLTFQSPMFDPAKEPPNPINPIPGHAVLQWLKTVLENQGVSVTAIDAEDWGWYFEAKLEDKYLVGASGAGTSPAMEWTIQVEKLRSLREKVFGKNKMTGADPLFRMIENGIRAEPAFQDVIVDLDA